MNGRIFMEKALVLAAEAAADGEVPVGAVIVRESSGTIVGTGRNRREKSRNALAHAELEAINSACGVLGGWRLEGCTMYVTLEPCPMCAGAVMNARLDRVVFGAYDKRSGACGSAADIFSSGYDCKTEINGGFMEEECSAVIKQFFAGLRKRRGKFRLTCVSSEDQIRRAAEASGISAEDISRSEVYFLRRGSVPVGILINDGGDGKVMIFDEFKNSGFAVPDITELLENLCYTQKQKDRALSGKPKVDTSEL